MGLGGYSSNNRIASTGGQYSRKIVREGAQLQVYSLKTTNGSVWFRPWCDTEIVNGMVVNKPERAAENPDYLLPTWFGMEAICTQCGLDFKFDCVASCSDAQEWGGSSPILLFTEAARAVAKNNPNVKELLFKEYSPANKTFPGLTVADKGLIKGALFRMDGKMCTKNVNGVEAVSPTMPVILLLTKSAAGWLETACTHRNADGALALENVASFANGSVLEFDYEDRILAGQDIDVTKGFARASAKKNNANSKGDGPKYHSGRVLSNYDAQVRTTDQGMLQQLHQLNESMADALYYMTGQEQIEECLLPGFGSQLRDLIKSVFEARGVLPAAFLNARTTVDMGGFGAPAVPGTQGAGLVMPGLGAPAGAAGMTMSMGVGSPAALGGGLAGAPAAAVSPAGMQMQMGVGSLAAGVGVTMPTQGALGQGLAIPGQPNMMPNMQAGMMPGGGMPAQVAPSMNVGAVTAGANDPATLAAQLEARMQSMMGGQALGGQPTVQGIGGMLPNG